jgi:hypothetical protein
MSKETPNDQEFGAKVREYLNNNRTCCDKEENMGIYIDGEGHTFPQCKKCGKILI